MMWPVRVSSKPQANSTQANARVHRQTGDRPSAARSAEAAPRRVTMEIKKIGVVGCGLMGGGIAEGCARAGFDTVVREVDDAVLGAGLGRIKQSMDTAVQRGRLAGEDRDAAQRRLR